MHGSYPGYSLTQGSCPPIEIDSEAHSMHGSTGERGGEGREPAKPLGLSFWFLLFCFSVPLV